MTQLLLGIDTASPATTVALVRRDRAGALEPVASADNDDPRGHGQVLPRLVTDVLATAGVGPTALDAVVVGVGPGAYTGLRVGLAFGQATGQTLGIPVLGVVTVDAVAFATGRQGPFAIITDARRHEFFRATYHDYRTPRTRPEVLDEARIGAGVTGLVVLRTPGTPEPPGLETLMTGGPSAVAICSVAVDRELRGLPTEPVQPLYLRRPDVSMGRGPKSVLP